VNLSHNNNFEIERFKLGIVLWRVLSKGPYGVSLVRKKKRREIHPLGVNLRVASYEVLYTNIFVWGAGVLSFTANVGGGSKKRKNKGGTRGGIPCHSQGQLNLCGHHLKKCWRDPWDGLLSNKV